jgi:CheY-like chemotaxis protein
VERHERGRVVVADDHPRILDVATAILSQAFDVVASAPDGAAAIVATLRLNADVVVLDVTMPGLDGFQTAARIRASGSAARIVFFSNHTGDDFVLAGVSRGASAFVAKSDMERDLVAAVRHALAGRAFVPSAAVLPRWRRPPGRRHDLQLYTTDVFLIDAVMSFFESALEAGDSIIANVSHAHRQALDAQFRARGFDCGTLVRSGRFAYRDAAEALDPILRDGMPDSALFAGVLEPLLERGLAASTGSPPHVSLFGEVAPILCERGEFDSARRLERIASEYAASRPISILCAYSTECLAGAPGDLAAGICAEHSTVVPADRTNR